MPDDETRTFTATFSILGSNQMPTSFRKSIALRFGQFRANCAGVAAVEFAFIAPVLMIMTIGIAEASRAVMMHKRYQRSVAMVGDLVSREDAIGTTAAEATAEMAGMMKAAEQAMAPYSFATLKIGVSAIMAPIAPATQTTVAWSYPYHSYPVSACGANKNMPAANMISAGNAAILVEGQYTYTPLIANLIPGFKGSVTWTDTIAYSPRGACPDYAGKKCSC